MASNTSLRGFDPILEGYKIRRQETVQLPVIPDISSPVLEYDTDSEPEQLPEAPEGTMVQPELFMGQLAPEGHDLSSNETAQVPVNQSILSPVLECDDEQEQEATSKI